MVGDLSEDLLEGVAAIAQYTGMTTRRVFYLVERNQLPAFKIGNRWCALRSVLRGHFTELSGADRRAS